MSADKSTAHSRKGIKLKRHGLSHNPLWNRWRRMIQRCHGGASSSDRYTRKNITVCRRWRDSFDAFLADMGEPPTPRHSIERIDNDGNYEPRNCRWATRVEQSRNRDTSATFTIDGVTKTLAEWLEMSTIGRTTVEGRLQRGWPIKVALQLSKKRTRPKGYEYGTKHFQVSGVDGANGVGVEIPARTHGDAVSGSTRQHEPLKSTGGGVAQSVEQRTFKTTDSVVLAHPDESPQLTASADPANGEEAK